MYPMFKSEFMYSLHHGMLELEGLFKVALSPSPDAETECDFTEVGVGPYREWN